MLAADPLHGILSLLNAPAVSAQDFWRILFHNQWAIFATYELKKLKSTSNSSFPVVIQKSQQIKGVPILECMN